MLRVWSVNKKQRKRLKKEGIGIPTAAREILKKGGALCRLPWLAYEENSRFQVKITLETTFWRITSWHIDNSTKAFRCDAQDFEDARLILTSAACKWFQKIMRAQAKAFRDDILEIAVVITYAK